MDKNLFFKKLQKKETSMTHVPSAVAKKMDKFFLLAQEKENLARKLAKVREGEKDNIRVVYRRLIGHLEKKMALLAAEIDSLEFALACSSCTLSE